MKAFATLRAKSVVTIGFLLALSGFSSPALAALVQAGKLTQSKLVDFGSPVAAAAARQPVTITAYLRFRNTEELDALIEDQKTPGHPQYGRYLTPAEFHARFSPLPSDVAAVRAELGRLGFKVLDSAPNGAWVRASGTVSTIKSAFHISQNLYSVGGKTVRGYSEQPVLSSALAERVLFIGGLDDSRKFIHPLTKTYSQIRSKSGAFADPPIGGSYLPAPCNVNFGPGQVSGTLTPAPDPYPATLPFAGCGYTAAQLRTAYGIDQTKLDGATARIGIVDMLASKTMQHDLNAYSKQNGLPQVNYSNFIQINPPGLIDGPDFTNCGPASGWGIEETLDLEAAHAIAPKATLVYFGAACANNDPLPDLALYNAIDTRAADVISNSWGEPEAFIPQGQLEAGDQAFKEAQVLGETILVSSGDAGDFILSDLTTTASASWPASSPYVTAVGGTSLFLTKDGRKTEYGWGNWTNEAVQSTWTGPFQILAGGYFGWGYSGGSGGGRSLFYSQPAYQKGVVPKSLSNYGVTAGGATINYGVANRVLPDISLVADLNTGFSISATFIEATPGTPDLGCTLEDAKTGYELCSLPIGGTSLSSPALAGIVALVNQTRLASGKPPVGFLNPDLYKVKIGRGSALRDVGHPTSPIALIDELFNGPLILASIDSAPDATGAKVVEGSGDTSETSVSGFDTTTGLGTPWVPALVTFLNQ